MPRSGLGVASQPSDTSAVSGTAISSTKFNTIMTDVYSLFNTAWPVSLSPTASDLGALTTSTAFTSYVSAVTSQSFSDTEKAQARTNIGAAKNDAAPVGSVYWFLLLSPPTGYLELDGRTIGSASSGATALASADASQLFAVIWDNTSNTVSPIQTSSGIATTRGASAAADFAANKRLPLPDARGEFIRSLSNGRASVDVSRALGSAQTEMIGPHNHTGTASAAGAHSHGIQGGGGSGDVTKYRDGSGSTYNGETDTAPDHTHTLVINNNSGTENRPRNLAFLCCIKY